MDSPNLDLDDVVNKDLHGTFGAIRSAADYAGLVLGVLPEHRRHETGGQEERL